MFSIGPLGESKYVQRWNESLFVIFHPLVWIFTASQNHSIFVSFLSSFFYLVPLFCVHFYIARSREKDTETVAVRRTMERHISAAIPWRRRKFMKLARPRNGAAYRWKSIEHRFLLLFSFSFSASDRIVLPWATVFQKFQKFPFFFFIDSNVSRSSKLKIVALAWRWEKMKDICSTARNFFIHTPWTSFALYEEGKNTQIF